MNKFKFFIFKIDGVTLWLLWQWDRGIRDRNGVRL